MKRKNPKADQAMKKPDPPKTSPASMGGAKFTLSQLHTVRVLAMLGVFFHHLWGGLGAGEGGGTVQRVLAGAFELGALGVIFFNFMSGFLLARPHLGPKREPFPGYAHFLKNRFLRIVPACYIAAIAAVAANMAVFGVGIEPSASMLAKLLSFTSSFSYSMLSTNVAAYWYLGLLAQFYLLFPLVLRLFERLGGTKAFLLLAGVCWGGCGLLSFHVSANPDSALGMASYMVYFNLPARLPEFAMGMWLASAWKPSAEPNRRLEWSFLGFCYAALIVSVVAFPVHATLGPTLSSIHNALACFAIFMAFFTSRKAARVGANRFMTLVAAASYGIYLVHQPLLSYVGAWLGSDSAPLLRLAVLTAIVAPLSLVAAVALDYLSGKIVKLVKEK